MKKEKSREFCIFRLEKLQTHGRGAKTLSQSIRHLDKHEQAADISHPELSGDNRRILKSVKPFKKIADILDKARDFYDSEIDKFNATRTDDEKPKRHMQKRAAQAFEGILTFSPEMAKKVDIDSWVQANVQFLEKEFESKGCVPLRIDLHMDEETPHIHFVYATTGRELLFMAKDVIGSRADLSKLQDRYAEAMSTFNLKRGHSRYNDYLALCQRARNKGYGNEDGSITYEQVKTYCEDYGEKIPKFRKHQTVREWKTATEFELLQQQAEIKRKNEELDRIEKLIEQRGWLIPEEYLDLMSECRTYKELLEIAKTIPAMLEGKKATVYELMLVIKAMEEKGIGNDGPEH